MMDFSSFTSLLILLFSSRILLTAICISTNSSVRLDSLWWSSVVGGSVEKVLSLTAARSVRLESDCPSSMELHVHHICAFDLFQSRDCIVGHSLLVNTKRIDYCYIETENIGDIDCCIKIQSSCYLYACPLLCT